MNSNCLRYLLYFHFPNIDISNLYQFYKASKARDDPDLLTWDQAMAESPDQVKKWLEAADVEIQALEHKETWEEVGISKSTV